MSRKQERARRKLEHNLIAECNRIQRKYYPELFSRFAKVKDPRNQSYIDYSTKTIFLLLLLCYNPVFDSC